MREKYNRDLTNLDLTGRGSEIYGVGWLKNVYNLFNNSGIRCGIIEMWETGMGEDEAGDGFVRTETVLALR